MKTNKKRKLKRSNPIPRVQAIVIFTVLVAVSAVFFTIYAMFTGTFLEDIRERAETVKGYVEQTVTIQNFESLDDAAFTQTRESLKQFKEIGGIRHLYIVSLDSDGSPVIAFNNLYTNEENQNYRFTEELMRDLLTCLNTGETVGGDGIYKTEWGRVYSLYYPVLDKNNTVLGAVGMEFDVTAANESHRRAMYLSMVVSGILIIIFCTVSSLALQKYLKENRRIDLAAHKAEVARERAEAANEAIMSSINYASKIQKNVLPLETMMEQAFYDYSVLWSPRDVVGGDIYWMKKFDDGVVLCVADCTGHGTPGAFLTMLVVSSLENAVDSRNYKDTADIIWQLEQKLVSVFKVKSDERQLEGNSDISDGCDLAVMFISEDKSVTVSAGNTNVFVCDGRKVNRIRGQKIYVGEGKIERKEDIKTVFIPANPDNKFYVASDGIFDQKGGEEGKSFGYRRFEKLILENHNNRQSDISNAVWSEFEQFRGTERRRDDAELISFKP